jgi:hypothetical protein
MSVNTFPHLLPDLYKIQYNRCAHNAVCEYHRNQLSAGHTFLMGMAILKVKDLLKVNNYGFNNFYNFSRRILMHYLFPLNFNSKYLFVKSSSANF